MQLSPLLAQVHDAMLAAAALGDERTREVATGLAAAAAPAVRLAVLDALHAAADEITAALLDHPGAPAVTVRPVTGTPDPAGLGNDVEIGVRTTATGPVGETRTADDGDASARISLRLSERLKTDVEQAAAKDGVSVNAWLVRAAQAALEPNPFAAFGAWGSRLGRMPGLGGFGGGFGPGGFGPGGPGAGARGEPRGGGERITGWIDG